MPRFFFDVLHGRRVCEDPEGQNFIDLDAARAEAVASAQYLVAHGILRNEDVSDRSFLIRDEDEQTVATVPFRDSLPGTLSGGPLSGPTSSPASARAWSGWSVNTIKRPAKASGTSVT